jgi:hypothetical protein
MVDGLLDREEDVGYQVGEQRRRRHSTLAPPSCLRDSHRLPEISGMGGHSVLQFVWIHRGLHLFSLLISNNLSSRCTNHSRAANHWDQNRDRRSL